MQVIVRVILAVCSVIIFIFIVAICYEVIVRSAFHRPTSWVVEVCSYLFLWLALLSSAVAIADDRQLRIDFIINLLKGRRRVIAEIAVLMLMLATVLVYIGYGLVYLVDSYRAGWVHGWGRLYIPMAYTHAALPLVDSLIAFFLIVKISQQIKRLKESDKELEGSAPGEQDFSLH